MDSVRRITTVSVVNYFVEEFGKYFVAFLVPSHNPDGGDEGMSRVIHSSLDTLIQGETIGSFTIPEAGV